jgi:hypothetical protein
MVKPRRTPAPVGGNELNCGDLAPDLQASLALRYQIPTGPIPPTRPKDPRPSVAPGFPSRREQMSKGAWFPRPGALFHVQIELTAQVHAGSIARTARPTDRRDGRPPCHHRSENG